jgi:hypothetical protein
MIGHQPPPLKGTVYDLRRDQTSLLANLDKVSYLMDRLIAVPGTDLRVGLNTLLLVLPVAGDGIASLVSFGILALGLSNHRVPRIVATRMVLNSLLDASVGWIPVVGDLFDLFFKADTRNVRLLMEYAGPNRDHARTTAHHWAAVLGLAGVFVMVLALLGTAVVALSAGLVSLSHER